MNGIEKAYNRLYDGERIPRKHKKHLLGRKNTKKELRQMIDAWIKRDDDFLDDFLVFCPNCGCHQTKHTHYPVEYPEVWFDVFCLRCKQRVGGADNSRPRHILEDLREERNHDSKGSI